MLHKLIKFYNKYITTYMQFKKDSKHLVYLNETTQNKYEKVETLLLKNEIDILCENDLEELSRSTRIISLCFTEQEEMQEALTINIDFILKNKWKYKIAYYTIEALCILGITNKIK